MLGVDSKSIRNLWLLHPEPNINISPPRWGSHACAALALSGCANGSLFNHGNERVYNPQVVDQALPDNDVVYRDGRGRYYCRRENGTTGTLVGAGVGALLGNIIAPGGSRTVGTLIGGAGGRSPDAPSTGRNWAASDLQRLSRV